MGRGTGVRAEREPPESSDRSLAESLIAGNPEAFEPFVARFGPLILNFGRRMCGRSADAEDLLQETLLKAYQSIKNLRDPAALKGWVYRVAANTCLKLRRPGSGATKRDLSIDELLPRPDAGGGAPEVADWSDVPLDRLLQGELRARLEDALLALPKDFRLVLILREQEGFSTRETASILGISDDLAKVRLHRARLAVRKTMEGYLSGPSGRSAKR